MKANTNPKANAALAGKVTVRKANRGTPKDAKPLVHRIAGCHPRQSKALQSSIRAGFSFGALALLANAYGVSMAVMANALAIPAGSIHRRRSNGALLPAESDRAYRLARLYDLAFPMMRGDAQATSAWLCTPLEILGNESPFRHADTYPGYADVEDLIGRIRHGVFC